MQKKYIKKESWNKMLPFLKTLKEFISEQKAIVKVLLKQFIV